jgi:hypothetical protein
MINVGVALVATVVGANRCVACSAKAAKTNVPTSVATDIPIRARNNLAMSANAGTAIKFGCVDWPNLKKSVRYCTGPREAMSWQFILAAVARSSTSQPHVLI